jgi:hypothetical protein
MVGQLITALQTPEAPLRFATRDDIDFVHGSICDAVRETVGHIPEFVALEERRFCKEYLHALIERDPAYVMVVTTPEGERTGIMVSGPEHGNLVLYWAQMNANWRKGSFALRSLHSYLKYWRLADRFHQIHAYAKVDNRAAQLVMLRGGFKHVCVLEKHLYGVDIALLSYPLEKTAPGFETVVSAPGLRGRLTKKLSAIFGAR